MLKLAAEATWVTKAAQLKPAATWAVPPAFPNTMARLRIENSGRVIQNRILNTRCNQS